MTNTNQNNTSTDWIDIAISDLKSARILFKKKQYHTSYFLFQQASEKANKAFWLYNDMATEKELYEVSHNQLKLYRRVLVEKGPELNNQIEAIRQLPADIRKHEIMDLDKMHSVQAAQSEIIKFIDGLGHRDLVNISSAELKHIFKQINSLNNPKLKLSRKTRHELKEYTLKIADLIGKFATPDALNAKNELQEYLDDPVKSKKFYKVMKKMLKLTIDSAFLFYSFWTCALLTIQHSSITRYPKDGKSPLQIYSAKLPLVKKQPLFMQVLLKALNKLRKLQ